MLTKGKITPVITYVFRIAVASVFITLVGCATIFSGTADEITINSHPGDASVKIKAPNGNVVAEGNTPMSIDLRRGKTYTVIVSREGYSPATATIKNGGIVKSFWLNALPGRWLDGLLTISVELCSSLIPRLSTSI